MNPMAYLHHAVHDCIGSGMNRSSTQAMTVLSISRRQTRVAPVSGCRRRIGTELGFDVRVGEHAGVLPRRFRGDSDREGDAVAARRKAGDDLAVVDRERDRALVGDQYHREEWRCQAGRSGTTPTRGAPVSRAV